MKIGVKKLLLVILVGVIILLNAFYLNKNLNIGIAFLSNTFMVFIYIYLLIVIGLSIKEKLKTPFLLVLIVIVYSIFSIVPTVNFYVDLLGYNGENYSEYIGIVEKINVSGLKTIVDVDDQQFIFYGPFNSGDLDLGKKTQISFLKRSKTAASYKIVVN